MLVLRLVYLKSQKLWFRSYLPQSTVCGWCSSTNDFLVRRVTVPSAATVKYQHHPTVFVVDPSSELLSFYPLFLAVTFGRPKFTVV